MMMKKILLGHGSGGKLMHSLIKDVLVKHLANPYLNTLSDASIVKVGGKKIAFTTDSFVVKPLFFPGSDIGKLAVYGTVNDLSVMGAMPYYISCAIIVEEGFEIKKLERITRSLQEAAKRARVHITTGDFKVVEKGSCDGIFINTAGIGEVLSGIDLRMSNIKPSDKIIINGPVGEHGIAVMKERMQLDFDFSVKSDCAPLRDLVAPLFKIKSAVKFMRDPTRGGLATTLNEITDHNNLGIMLEEKSIPITPSVRAACEILGLDPLYIANEGKVIVVVAKDKAPAVLALLRRHPLGKKAAIIGEVVRAPRGKVCLNTRSGGVRIVDMLTSDPLPRIC
ncbi:hydrogenase expression/formation protein HypE [Candidatus Omnitrophota bacterium]